MTAIRFALIVIAVAVVCLIIANVFVDLKITAFKVSGFYVQNFAQVPSDNPSVTQLTSVKDKTITFKQILLWNSPHRIEVSAFGTGYDPFIGNDCKYKHCIIITNSTKANLSEIDAVVINMHELWLTKLPSFERQSFQRFVFLSQESPTTLPINPSDYKKYFNWTMSYRLDSDVRLLYGRVKPHLDAPKTLDEARNVIGAKNGIDYTVNKTKLVAWFVSHCETASLREKYVAELQKYIPVDIYGGCGNMTCKRNNDHWLSYPECYDMLEHDYKFYLSFENSLCTDYVTEKFFNILQRRIVPVVYGAADYKNVAPFHSYIDASAVLPKVLAEYLQMLDRNNTLYNEFFFWKDFYDVEAGVEQMSRHAFCDMCGKLHADSETKVYEDMATQWSSETECRKPLIKKS